MKKHRLRQLLAKLLALDRFSIKSICHTTGASQNDITVVRRMMKTVAGRARLQAEEPRLNRTHVLEGHVRAVRDIANGAPHLFDAAWKIRQVMASYQDLPPLKLPTLRRIMKQFAGLSYRKVGSRPPKQTGNAYSNARVALAKLMLALHKAGCTFVYMDEYSC